MGWTSILLRVKRIPIVGLSDDRGLTDKLHGLGMYNRVLGGERWKGRRAELIWSVIVVRERERVSVFALARVVSLSVWLRLQCRRFCQLTE